MEIGRRQREQLHRLLLVRTRHSRHPDRLLPGGRDGDGEEELLLRVLPGERAATRLETTLRSQTRDPGLMFPVDGGPPFSGAPPFKGLWRPKVSMVVTTVSHCFSELSWMERDSTTTAMALLRACLEGVHGGQGVSKG